MALVERHFKLGRGRVVVKMDGVVVDVEGAVGCSPRDRGEDTAPFRPARPPAGNSLSPFPWIGNSDYETGIINQAARNNRESEATAERKICILLRLFLTPFGSPGGGAGLAAAAARPGSW